MAAPAFGSAGAFVGGSSSTTAAIPVPASVAADDIILVFLYVESTSLAITPDTGFTEVTDSPGFSVSTEFRIYWKRATGADSGTYNFTVAAGLTYRNGIALRYTGCVTTGNPFDVTNSALKTTTTDGTTPSVSVTTTGPDRCLVWAATLSHAAACPTLAGWAERADQNTNNGLAIDDVTQAVAGSSGSITNTFTTGTGSSEAWLGALLPISAAAPQSPPPLIIPNRYVGPMALRQAFRRAQMWIAGPDSFSGASTDLTATVGLTADGVVGTVGTSSTAVTVGLSAAGVVGTVGTASTAITVGLTASGVVGTVGTSSTAITVGLTADGVVGVVDTGAPAAPLRIPNRNVGPMALRQAFRQPQPSPGPDNFYGRVGSSGLPYTLPFSLVDDGILVTVGLTADGVVASVTDTGAAQAPLIIPNRYVGPMALRQAFRRAQPWTAGPDSLNVSGTSTDLTVTVGLTAAGVVGTVGTATTAVTVGLTAAGVVGTTGQASTAVTVGLTAAGAVGTTSTTSTAVTVGLTATGVVGTTSTASTAVTVGLSADGVVGLVGTADTAIIVGLAADGSNPANVVPAAQAPFLIPNRYVGPMALRNSFRRAQQWLSATTDLQGSSSDSAVTVGLTAAGVVGTSSTASTAVSMGLTATGVVGTVGQTSTAVTVGLTSAGVVGTSSTASTVVTVGLTATGVVGTVSSTSTAVSVGLTAAGVVGTSSTASTVVTVGLTSAGVVGVSKTTTVTAVSVSLTAAGIVGTQTVSSTTISVGLTSAGVVGTSSTGSTTITIGLTAGGFVTTDHLSAGAALAVVVALTAAGSIQIFTAPQHTVTARAVTIGSSANAATRTTTADVRTHGSAADGTTRTGTADATTRETTA